MTSRSSPTPYPAVNTLLQELLQQMQAVLGPRLIGLYLDGSLTSGAFDADSDIDFVAVCTSEISEELFLALQTMHDRLATFDSPFAVQLEGSYFSRQGLRRYDPALARFPNLERGSGERLKWVEHGEYWAVHRVVLRERGIPLIGPPPHSLIDPVLPAELRHAMHTLLNGWAANFLDHPEGLAHRGYQSYVVLSLCRILYTLHSGAVASKPAAARWAQETLGEPWALLIERAWTGRSHPNWQAEPADLDGTLAFIRYSLENHGRHEPA